MLQVDNRSAFRCKLGVFPDEDGVESAYGVIKATFAIDPAAGVRLADEQDEIALVDEPWGDPLASSIRVASEMTLVKPATDVLLRGHAYAPGGEAKQVDVTLRVGPIEKTVRVFGDRAWSRGLFRAKASEPEPFARMPLLYERAFGGTDPLPVDESKVDYEPKNPIGRGLVPRDSRVDLEGLALPNLEDPARLIRGPKDRPPPASFGPLAGHWEPRRSYAGTYDEAWTKARAPYLPLDFNPRVFQAAPPDQGAEGYLRGGELVEIFNATPSGRLAFSLPACTPEMIFRLDGREHRHTPNLDTVSIDADAGRVWLIWRGSQAVDKNVMRLEVLRVTCPEYPKRTGT